LWSGEERRKRGEKGMASKKNGVGPTIQHGHSAPYSINYMWRERDIG